MSLKRKQSKLGRLKIAQETLRVLLAKSGNVCAFPGCTHPIFNEEDEYVANLCHIEAASPGGERYNPDMTDEERRHYSNLLFLCYQHHKETNNVTVYPVQRLVKMKLDHERAFGKKPYKIDESQLYKLAMAMDEYWTSVSQLAESQHQEREYPVDVNVNRDAPSIFEALRFNLEHIGQLAEAVRENDRNLPGYVEKVLRETGVDLPTGSVPYYVGTRNWELLTIGIGNALLRISADLLILEIKYLEEYLKTNHDDLLAKVRLEKLKTELVSLTESATLIE